MPSLSGTRFSCQLAAMFQAFPASPSQLKVAARAGEGRRLKAEGRRQEAEGGQREGADGFLREHGLRRGVRLADGSLALATAGAGLVTLGADGRFLGRLDEAMGLPRDQILDLFTDRENGVWLGLSSGIARAEMLGGVTMFDEFTGLRRATMNDLTRVSGTLFLASDAGLYRLAPAEPGPAARPARGERVAGGELWTLCADGVGGVLAGSVDAVYQWRPDGRTENLLGPGGGVQPRVLRPSRSDPARVWAGMREGLRSFRRDANGGWREEGLVAGLEGEEVRTVGEAADGAVWVGTPTRGVFRVTFAPTADGSRGAATTRRYFGASGLPGNAGWTRVRPWRGGGDVVFASQAGLFRHDAASDRFERVTEFGERFGDGTFMVGNFAEDAAGDAWVSGRSRDGLWRDQEIGRAPRGGAAVRAVARPHRRAGGRDHGPAPGGRGGRRGGRLGHRHGRHGARGRRPARVPDGGGRSGEHLLGMINEVLDLSKIEAGKLAAEPADFPLARLLDATAGAFRPRAAEKRIGFAVRRGPGLPAIVHGDEGRLRQVLFNLLGNAVRLRDALLELQRPDEPAAR